MQNFENVEDLVSYMFEKLEDDNTVSVVADKDLSVDVMRELLDYKNVILGFANIDTYGYDKEYVVSLYDDINTDDWYVSIEQIYDYENDIYLEADGYVLFYEDVNSKALVAMQHNENVKLSDYDWFVIGEDEKTDYTESDDVLTVNGKRVSVDEYNDFVSKFAPDKVIKTDNKSSTISKVEYKVNGINTTKEEYEKVLSNIEEMYLDNIRDMLFRYAEIMDECNEWRKLLHW